MRPESVVPFMSSSQTSVIDAPRGIRSNLRKSRLCTKHLVGRCQYGRGCCYAHSEDELSSKPDLAKTRLCYAYFRGECAAPSCMYAHGYAELRATTDLFKRELCHGWP